MQVLHTGRSNAFLKVTCGDPSIGDSVNFSMEAIFAVTVFVVVLAVIAAELVNRTVAALLGAAVVISFGVVEQHEAATEFVDWNTIGLLLGMMVIVAVLNKTGLFDYLAIKSEFLALELEA